jgi:ATP-dependent DNA helicase RecQ
MAQKRPINLDAMAQINGVGAKKLENFGNKFLEVINGEAERLHPSRRKLAGNKEGVLFDLLLEAQNKLTRGEKGLDKPLSCSTSLLVKVAQRRPSSIKEISHILGERRAERFGTAFLEIFIHAD